jgi:hypothetical protein
MTALLDSPIRPEENPDMADLTVVTLAQRPDLRETLNDFPAGWPEFMFHDPITVAVYEQLVLDDPRFCLLAIAADRPDRPVAKACTLPLSWAAMTLPKHGYDAALLTAAADRLRRAPARVVCAVEIVVQVASRGTGVSALMLDAARRNAAGLGFAELIAPVRPTGKHRYPRMSMADYVAWTRADGLPHDPWLRAHVRAGGQISDIAPYSMSVVGTLAQWRAWTGLAFDASGEVDVPQALAPVRCDVTDGYAIYVEPNVWVRHGLETLRDPSP